MIPSKILFSFIFVEIFSRVLWEMAFFSSTKFTMMFSVEYLFGAMMIMPSSNLYLLAKESLEKSFTSFEM